MPSTTALPTSLNFPTPLAGDAAAFKWALKARRRLADELTTLDPGAAHRMRWCGEAYYSGIVDGTNSAPIEGRQRFCGCRCCPFCAASKSEIQSRKAFEAMRPYLLAGEPIWLITLTQPSAIEESIIAAFLRVDGAVKTFLAQLRRKHKNPSSNSFRAAVVNIEFTFNNGTPHAHAHVIAAGLIDDETEFAQQWAGYCSGALPPNVKLLGSEDSQSPAEADLLAHCERTCGYITKGHRPTARPAQKEIEFLAQLQVQLKGKKLFRAYVPRKGGKKDISAVSKADAGTSVQATEGSSGKETAPVDSVPTAEAEKSPMQKRAEARPAFSDIPPWDFEKAWLKFLRQTGRLDTRPEEHSVMRIPPWRKHDPSNVPKDDSG